MKKTTLHSLKQAKGQQKFAMVTAYDATFAHWASESEVETILVGDSLGMVVQGRNSTLPVTLEHMVYHTEAVARGNQNCLIVADVPFMQAASIDRALFAAEKLMAAGAEVLKLEGDERLAPAIDALTAAGVPVCAHLGLTPQFVHRFGGYRVQGRTDESRQAMLRSATQLQDAGADMLLLECVPTPLATELTRQARVPVVGIGAGPETDGQVLVKHDLLGLNPHKLARFVKTYPERSPLDAFNAYAHDVHTGTFPGPEHGFDA